MASTAPSPLTGSRRSGPTGRGARGGTARSGRGAGTFSRGRAVEASAPRVRPVGAFVTAWGLPGLPVFARVPLPAAFSLGPSCSLLPAFLPERGGSGAGGPTSVGGRSPGPFGTPLFATFPKRGTLRAFVALPAGSLRSLLPGGKSSGLSERTPLRTLHPVRSFRPLRPFGPLGTGPIGTFRGFGSCGVGELFRPGNRPVVDLSRIAPFGAGGRAACAILSRSALRSESFRSLPGSSLRPVLPGGESPGPFERRLLRTLRSCRPFRPFWSFGPIEPGGAFRTARGGRPIGAGELSGARDRPLVDLP